MNSYKMVTDRIIDSLGKEVAPWKKPFIDDFFVFLRLCRDLIDFNPIERCESVWNGYKNPPILEVNGSDAYYRLSTDTIGMPRQELFECEEAYYSTLFHEMMHSTKHEKRLNRGDDNNNWIYPGFYIKEELIAEIGASYLCGYCNIEKSSIERSVSYIKTLFDLLQTEKSLVVSLQDKKKLVVSAASEAQNAVDYIFGKKDAAKKRKNQG